MFSVYMDRPFSPCWLMGNDYSVALEEFSSVSVRVFLYNLKEFPRTKFRSLISLKQVLRCFLCPLASQFRAMPNSSSHLFSTIESSSGSMSTVPLSSFSPGMEREQYLYHLVQVPNEDGCLALVSSEPRGWIYLTSCRCLCCVETYIHTSHCVIVSMQRTRHF